MSKMPLLEEVEYPGVGQEVVIMQLLYQRNENDYKREMVFRNICSVPVQQKDVHVEWRVLKLSNV